MKTKILKVIIALITIFTLTNCKMYRFVVYNFSDITDYKIFPSNKIETTKNERFIFPKSKNLFPIKSISFSTSKTTSTKTFENYLKENETVAFLVIKNDSILYENYFSDYEKSSIVASFSMAKSVLSLLVGCAIDDGKIKSVNEPITNYLPDLKDEFKKVTINDLLNMTSGIAFSESYYNPFGNAASVYYGTNLKKEILKLKLKYEPGTKFQYSSGDSQILGFVLQASLKEQTISNYLQEKIWIPLGMEYDATWSLDKKNGIEKTFCCLNARARDFAKIGRLFLNEGNWNGKQIVSKEWVKNSLSPNNTSGDYTNYKNQWWLNPEKGSYMAQGINGQYIYVNPSKKLIIVKLGKRYGKADWPELFNLISKKM